LGQTNIFLWADNRFAMAGRPGRGAREDQDIPRGQGCR
jgi:hypothetical protein